MNKQRDMGLIMFALFLVSLIVGIFIVIIFNYDSSYKHSNFFGAKVVGPYVNYYNGQLKCAYVEGWHSRKKCLCILTDFGFSNNRVLMPPDDERVCDK